MKSNEESTEPVVETAQRKYNRAKKIRYQTDPEYRKQCNDRVRAWRARQSPEKRREDCKRWQTAWKDKHPDHAERRRKSVRESRERLRKKDPDAYRAMMHRQHIRRTYGPDGEKFYWEQIQTKGWRCEICGHSPGKDEKKLCLDHEDVPGENGAPPKRNFRGILCHNCNSALGHFRHSPRLLREAATYVSERSVAAHRDERFEVDAGPKHVSSPTS